ncbi:hypothetical protein K1719_008042 [Acacia pycnantha]|nr:hypothetical protein K1719_008042 [Acacia pycnantha]
MAAASTVLFPCHTHLCYSSAGSHRIRAQERPPRRRRQKTLFVSSIYNRKASTFTYRTSDNVPLPNFPGVPPVRFEEYMEDIARKSGGSYHSRQINCSTRQYRNLWIVVFISVLSLRMLQNHHFGEAQSFHFHLKILLDEWRIKMPVIEAAWFFKTQPVADIRVTTKSNGQDYPPHVPSHIPKLCETHITKCELQGLHSAYTPQLFNLEASGTLYPVTHGTDACHGRYHAIDHQNNRGGDQERFHSQIVSRLQVIPEEHTGPPLTRTSNRKKQVDLLLFVTAMEDDSHLFHELRVRASVSSSEPSDEL